MYFISLGFPSYLYLYSQHGLGRGPHAMNKPWLLMSSALSAEAKGRPVSLLAFSRGRDGVRTPGLPISQPEHGLGLASHDPLRGSVTYPGRLRLRHRIFCTHSPWVLVAPGVHPCPSHCASGTQHLSPPKTPTMCFLRPLRHGPSLWPAPCSPLAEASSPSALGPFGRRRTILPLHSRPLTDLPVRLCAPWVLSLKNSSLSIFLLQLCFWCPKNSLPNSSSQRFSAVSLVFLLVEVFEFGLCCIVRIHFESLHQYRCGCTSGPCMWTPGVPSAMFWKNDPFLLHSLLYASVRNRLPFTAGWFLDSAFLSARLPRCACHALPSPAASRWFLKSARALLPARPFSQLLSSVGP